MRYILKRQFGEYHLNEANKNPPSDKDSATSRWSSFGYKDVVCQCLLDEQNFLCCYSEVKLEHCSSDAYDYHIEHVQPKSLYPTRTFDYQNLAVSAFSAEDLKSYQREELFGGHYKLGHYDPDLFISCHQVDCANYFCYTSDGRVVPALQLSDVEKAKAIYTIDILNLNSHLLVNLRQQYWDELEKIWKEHEQKNWSIEDLKKIQLEPISNRLYPFFSLSRQFFGDS
ncbi:TIGR02646 family protein [Beggiatoa alba B18LD]|uniref:TIGR02646 family protein n=1 Tax=Beggiatoa alba B18LD TaxID=395493 RepID=I3CHV5_9GAMM|nr:retron system putative HNH endonuclease [Beggiatoa alba]EIJ43198.1 TIGR02646 family protein [Beggiatoa alba B18LD]